MLPFVEIADTPPAVATVSGVADAPMSPVPVARKIEPLLLLASTPAVPWVMETALTPAAALPRLVPVSELPATMPSITTALAAAL
jgi:hypothetical protein